MNKTELVEKVAATTDLKFVDAKAAVDAAIAHIGEELKGGGRVTIPGFATFNCYRAGSRMAHNPATGGKVEVPEKWVVKIKPSEGLKKAVQGVAVGK